MLNNQNIKIGYNGKLFIGEFDTTELAKKYGTPLYIIDENKIIENAKGYLNAFNEFYEGNAEVLYASKALNCKSICSLANKIGLGLDVVSGGEIFTAKAADFPMNKVHFHGNNKTFDELEMAIKYGVGTIVVDNIDELHILNELGKKYNRQIKISLRIKPGIDAHTHSFIKTGQIDSKFGFSLENGEALSAVEGALSFKMLNLVELHCHIGSQIFEEEPFKFASEIMVGFIKKIKDEFNYEIGALNLGGGFGIKYKSDDKPLPYNIYIKSICETVKKETSKHDLKPLKLLIEPGRSIVGEAGITLYTVGGVKEISNVRNYISVDGGMTDNIRYALYNSDYTIINASRANEQCDYCGTIAGKCCESGDMIQENVKLAKPEIGDILAVLSTGAYNYSMASNYNRIPRPAMVAINGSEDRLIIKRETYEDIIKNDL